MKTNFLYCIFGPIDFISNTINGPETAYGICRGKFTKNKIYALKTLYIPDPSFPSSSNSYLYRDMNGVIGTVKRELAIDAVDVDVDPIFVIEGEYTAA